MSYRSILAEALGSLLLFATVVGSGIMADRLAGGNVAVALLGNTVATGATCVLGFVAAQIAGAIAAHFASAVIFPRRWKRWHEPHHRHEHCSFIVTEMKCDRHMGDL